MKKYFLSAVILSFCITGFLAIGLTDALAGAPRPCKCTAIKHSCTVQEGTGAMHTTEKDSKPSGSREITKPGNPPTYEDCKQVAERIGGISGGWTLGGCAAHNSGKLYSKVVCDEPTAPTYLEDLI